MPADLDTALTTFWQQPESVERGRLPTWPKFRAQMADLLGVPPAELFDPTTGALL